jgi:hypothetical protein
MKPDKVLTNEDRATISKLLLQLEKTRDLQRELNAANDELRKLTTKSRYYMTPKCYKIFRMLIVEKKKYKDVAPFFGVTWLRIQHIQARTEYQLKEASF